MLGMTYRITRKKAHPGDNKVEFKNIITGCAIVGGVIYNVSPVIATMHGNLAALGGMVLRGCANVVYDC